MHPPRLARLLGCLVALLVVACGPKPVPLTAELRHAHAIDDGELRRLQLYVSHEVTLRREDLRRERRIDGGALRLRSGKVVDEVVIRARTPCVATEISHDAITVALEDGSTLRFELEGGEATWPAPGSPLRLVPLPEARGFATAPDPRPLPPAPQDGPGGGYWLAVREGVVLHRGLPWQVAGDGLRAQLLVAAEELLESDERRTVVGGRRL
ncbi:MAG: DNA-directed RNA polymerase [Deltaproteobacteria bacterium]|nr:DNA-directed RNA polymerase [Deltaproteobacteria bacterium]